MKKCRLALVIPTLDQGGAEKQLCLLAAGLPRDQFDVHVVVLTRSGPRESYLRDQNIPIHLIEKNGKVDPFAWQRLTRLFKTLRPDIVHTWIFAANAYGRTAALAAKVPVVAASERSVDPWKSAWQLMLDRYLAKKAPRITTNSNGVVDFYVQKGIPSECFSLIPNAVTPLTKSERSREEIANMLQIPPHRKWIVSIGRLWPQKGYKDMIWSAEMLRVLREDTSYIIIGDGPERERLELYRDNVRAASQVYFVGERRDATDILQHADLLWNGSLYEGQSNVILEAMQSGVPVFASDIPGNRDLIRHEDTGLLFTLGDVNHLTQLSNVLLSNEELRQRLSRNAKSWVDSEHTLDAMIVRHTTLYLKWMDGIKR